MPRNICSVCDNDSFENISGYYYCTVCNTKAQVKIISFYNLIIFIMQKLAPKVSIQKKNIFFTFFVHKTKLSLNF